MKAVVASDPPLHLPLSQTNPPYRRLNFRGSVGVGTFCVITDATTVRVTLINFFLSYVFCWGSFFFLHSIAFMQMEGKPDYENVFA